MSETITAAVDIGVIMSALQTNRKSGGGRGESSDTSQLEFLGQDNAKWLLEQIKTRGKVKVTDLLHIGSEFFRKEMLDLAVRKSQSSAKTLSKVTVLDLELILQSGETVLFSKITNEQAKKVAGFGKAFIKNTQYKCSWPLVETETTEGSPAAKDLVYLLTPWSLLQEAIDKVVQK